MLRRSTALALLCATFLLGSTASPSWARATPEAGMVREINAVRTAHGLRTLRLSPSLRASARRRSHLMLVRDVFAHFPSSARSFSPIGEVIAIKRGWRPGAAVTVSRWMRSPPHRAVLLYPSLRYVGPGQARGRFQGRRATTWVVRVGGQRRSSRRRAPRR